MRSKWIPVALKGNLITVDVLWNDLLIETCEPHTSEYYTSCFLPLKGLLLIFLPPKLHLLSSFLLTSCPLIPDLPTSCSSSPCPIFPVFLSSHFLSSYIPDSYTPSSSTIPSYISTSYTLPSHIISSYTLLSYTLRSHILRSHILSSHLLLPILLLPILLLPDLLWKILPWDNLPCDNCLIFPRPTSCGMTRHVRSE